MSHTAFENTTFGVQTNFSGLKSISCKYDGLNRMIYTSTEADDPFNTYSDGIQTENYRDYDSVSNVLHERQIVKFNNVICSDENISMNYNDMGSRTNISADDYNVNYVFDNLQRISEIDAPDIDISQKRYYLGNGGRVTKLEFGNDVVTEIWPKGYDNFGRIINIKHLDSNDNEFCDFGYGWDSTIREGLVQHR